ELDDLLPGADQRIGEDQQQIPGPSHLERRGDRCLLIRDDRDSLCGYPGGRECRGLYARDLFGLAVPQVVVAPADVMVEAPGNRARDGDEILIAPVTGTGQHHDTLTLHLETLRQV